MSATLSTLETRRLGNVRPELRAALLELRTRLAARGVRFTIPAFGGLRTPADQRQLEQWRRDSVAAGRGDYAVAAPGRSRHEFGAAFDIRITGRPATMTERAAYQLAGTIGEELGLVWGGRWTGAKNDPFHFQLRESFAETRTRWGRVAGGAATVVVLAALAGLWWLSRRGGLA